MPSVCPYCFRQVDPRSLTFVCQKQEPKCDNRFTADGRNDSAVCGSCGLKTKIRECPECKRRLPPLFGATDSKLFSVVGATSAGKTVFTSVLMKEWRDRIGAPFGSSVAPFGRETVVRWGENVTRIYEQHLPDGTDASGRSEPYIFLLDFERGSNRRSSVTLSFMDPPGEHYRDGRVEQYERHIASADGIIVLLDPTIMSGTAGFVDPSQVQTAPSIGGGVDRPDNGVVVDNVKEFIREFRDDGRDNRFGRFVNRVTGTRAKIDVPVAVVIAKIDAVEDGVGELGSHLGDVGHDGFYNAADAERVHQLVRGLLIDWDGTNIDTTLQAAFSNYRYFAASALGHPVQGNQANSVGVQPMRIADPLLWLLSETNIVRSRVPRPVS